MVPAGVFLLLESPVEALGIAQILTFLPFWMGAAARKAATALACDFLCKRASFLFIFGVFERVALGCDLWRRRFGLIVHGVRKRGARPLDAARSLTRLCYHFGQCVDGEGLVRRAGFKREEAMGCKPLHLGKG